MNERSNKPMKKAILIVGIIWIVISLGVAITEISFGIGQMVHLQSAGVDWQPDYVRGGANVGIGGYYVLSIVLTLILIFKRNSNMSKGAGIALGVISAIFGSLVPGILFAVDSAQSRQ